MEVGKNKKEGGREGTEAARRGGGCPPFWSSLRRDGGHTGMVEGEEGGDQQDAS